MNKPSLESLYETPASSKTEAQKSADPVSQAEQPETPEPSASETPPPSSDETAAAGTGEPPEPSKAKAAKSDAPPASEEDLPSDVQGLRAALKAERQKRKERDTKLTEAEKKAADAERVAQERDEMLRRYFAQQAQLQHQQPQPTRQAPQPPDPLVDPEAAFAYMGQRTNAELYRTRVELSQGFMRAQHKDYDEMESVFVEEAQANPALADQLVRHPVPAQFAYEMGKKLKLMRDIGSDPSAWEAKREAELREKLRAELEAEFATRQPSVPTAPKAPPPQSLAGVPSVTPRNASKANNGPTPLTDLYK
jgi:DNA primase